MLAHPIPTDYDPVCVRSRLASELRAMPIRTNCPECQSAYNLNEALAGKKVRCKACGHAFLVTPAVDEALPAALRVTATPGAPAKGVPADMPKKAPDLAAPAAKKLAAPQRSRGRWMLWLSLALFGAFALLACYHKYLDAINAYFFENRDVSLLEELAAAKIVDEPEPLDTAWGQWRG